MNLKFVFIICLFYIIGYTTYSLSFNKYYFKHNNELVISNLKNNNLLFSNIFNITNRQVITFFDVGQGDSIYIKTFSGHTALIDGGPSYEVDYKVNRKQMYPFCYFDYIFLTHFHFDHYEGLTKITQRCKYEKFFYPITFNDIPCDKNRCKSIVAINAKKYLKKDDLLINKTVNYFILWPDSKYTNVDYDNLNNTSLIILVDIGDIEILLTGDAEVESLSKLDIDFINSKIENGLDIYKVSHHGALNGHYLPLIKQLDPINCVISVGQGNKYNHPNEKVVNELKDICNIYRTDIHGDVTFIL